MPEHPSFSPTRLSRYRGCLRAGACGEGQAIGKEWRALR